MGAALHVGLARARAGRILMDVGRFGVRWEWLGLDRGAVGRLVRQPVARLPPALAHVGTDRPGHLVRGRAGLGRSGRPILRCAESHLDSGPVEPAAEEAEAAVLVALGAGLARLLWPAGDPSARSSSSADGDTPRLRDRNRG